MNPFEKAADHLGRDLRYAARNLLQSPAFVVVSVLSLGLGLMVLLVVTPVLGAVVYGISPWDPVSSTAGILVLVLAAVAASLAPALRSARVDPVESLRYE